MNEHYQTDGLVQSFDFKVLEMYYKNVIDYRMQSNGMAIKISFKDKENSEKHEWQIIWKETINFVFKIPSAKEKRPFIYLSKDTTKLMVLP